MIYLLNFYRTESALKNNAIVITNGCPENRIDCAETEQCLVQHGWVMTEKPDQADLIVLNLCGLLNEIEAQSLSLVKQVKNIRKSDAKIILTGCLPKINNRAMEEFDSGDIITVQGHNIEGLLKALNTNEHSDYTTGNYLIPFCLVQETLINKIQKKIKNSLSPYSVLHRFHIKEYRKYWEKFNLVQPNTFYIKVSSGCEHACSYCAVKISRGAVKSKSTEEIKLEFLKGVKAGYKNFALIGSDLGSYGKDIQTDLPNLLKQLICIEGNFRIRLRNVHPQLLINQLPEMIEVVKSGQISHLTTAIQHGNDRVLKLMNRDYSIEDCINAINTLKQYSNNLKIRTQIIVGFPGETEKEFGDTLRLVGNVNVDFFEIYPFSSRTGTLASSFKNQNTINTIQKRSFIMTKRVLAFLRQKHSVPANN